MTQVEHNIPMPEHPWGQERTKRLYQTYKALAEEGLTQGEVAKRLGVSRGCVSVNGRRFGLKFAYDKRGPVHDVGRTADIISMFQDGMTLDQIGSGYGVSRERIRQIIKKYAGLTAKDGGAHARRIINRAERQRKREETCMARFGCTLAQYKSLLEYSRSMIRAGHGVYATPMGTFRSKRNNVLYNGGEWGFKLWDWWQVWEQSGHWDEKGRGYGKYGMIRIDKTKGYVPGNVKIAKFGQGWPFWGEDGEPVSEARPGSPESERT